MPVPVSSATAIKPEGLSDQTTFYKKWGMHTKQMCGKGLHEKGTV